MSADPRKIDLQAPRRERSRESRPLSVEQNGMLSAEQSGKHANGNSNDVSLGAMGPANADSVPPVPAEPELESAPKRKWLVGVLDYWGDRRTPAILVSFIVHTVILLVLALLSLRSQEFGSPAFDFVATNSPEEDEHSIPEEILVVGDAQPPPSPVVGPELEGPKTTTSATNAASEILALDSGDQPAEVSTAAAELQQILEATSVSTSSMFSSTGVEGRRPENRRKLALARGGTIESEVAVERALEWLAKHQLPSGAWSLIHNTGECDGRCQNPGSKERFDPAATGLALLAFLGAGYTHEAGEYRENVRKGVYFLYQIMEESSQGGSLMYQSDRGMYNHGIAAFALCEAYQLTEDPDLRHAAQLATQFIVTAQNYQGGWGYLPKQPGDLTVSGWQVMALKSAQAAGLKVPASTIFRLDNFLSTQQATKSAYFGYGKPGKSPTCTAIGNMMHLFRGMTDTDPRILESAQYLRRLGQSGRDIYFNYYATLYLFHVGEPFWTDWNPTVRDYLVKTQATGGHEAGSWYFDNPYGKEGGRLYTTAMAAMTLEVYYRFSPLYQQADEPFEL